MGNALNYIHAERFHQERLRERIRRSTSMGVNITQADTYRINAAVGILKDSVNAHDPNKVGTMAAYDAVRQGTILT